MKTEEDALRVAKEAVETRATGVAFGRNVWQSYNPLGMVKTLVDIIHDDKTVDAALARIRS
jgi:DhnA family fructose-bisphosphate aldolase class Ia